MSSSLYDWKLSTRTRCVVKLTKYKILEETSRIFNGNCQTNLPPKCETAMPLRVPNFDCVVRLKKLNDAFLKSIGASYVASMAANSKENDGATGIRIENSYSLFNDSEDEHQVFASSLYEQAFLAGNSEGLRPIVDNDIVMICQNDSSEYMDDEIHQHTFNCRDGHSRYEASNFRCQECSVEFQNADDLSSHRVQMHDVRERSAATTNFQVAEKAFACRTCGKRFSENATLMFHEALHADEKHNQRKIHAMQLDQRQLFKEHDDKKASECYFCSKRFKGRSHLKDHLLSHPDSRKRQCCVCRNRFERAKDLIRHSLTNKPSTRYQCYVCNKWSNSLEGFYEHMKSHDLTLVYYDCAGCGKLYWRKPDLMRHLRLCRFVFVCDTCNAVFKQEEELRDHEKGHGLNGNLVCSSNSKYESNTLSENGHSLFDNLVCLSQPNNENGHSLFDNLACSSKPNYENCMLSENDHSLCDNVVSSSKPKYESNKLSENVTVVAELVQQPEVITPGNNFNYVENGFSDRSSAEVIPNQLYQQPLVDDEPFLKATNGYSQADTNTARCSITNRVRNEQQFETESAESQTRGSCQEEALIIHINDPEIYWQLSTDVKEPLENGYEIIGEIKRVPFVLETVSLKTK